MNKLIKVSREQVLQELSSRGLLERPITTLDVAGWLGVEEYAVRGAISWLCIGGLLEVAGATRRIDLLGRPYSACVYHWHGEMVIPKVRRNRDERIPQAKWDVECYNILINSMTRRRAA